MPNITSSVDLKRLYTLWYRPVGILLLLLGAVLIGYLSWRCNLSGDFTHNQRNSLSKDSVQLLQSMPGAIQVQALSSNSPYKGRYFRKSIQSLLQRYQRQHHDFKLTFIDPVHEPAKARDLQLKKEGELLFEYQGQQARMYLPYTEEAVSNLLIKLKHSQSAPLVFIAGQGEASLDDHGPLGASALKQALLEAGIPWMQTTPTAHPQFSANATLVLAGANQRYSAQFVSDILHHLHQGGNLLWLVEDTQSIGLQALATQLGIDVSQGVAIDPGNISFQIAPHELASQHYANQGATEAFALRTFFTQAHRIRATQASQPYWQVRPLIAVAEHGWLSANYHPQQHRLPHFQPSTDQAGPVTIALSLQHIHQDQTQQRILIIGSRQFFQNAQQSRGGNQAMAIKLLQWTRNHDPVMQVRPQPLRDSIVLLPQNQQAHWLIMLLFNGAQFLIPTLFCFAGWRAWARRKV